MKLPFTPRRVVELRDNLDQNIREEEGNMSSTLKQVEEMRELTCPSKYLLPERFSMKMCNN